MKEKIKLDKHDKQETILDLYKHHDTEEDLEVKTIKKEENQENEAEETTEDSIENQNNPVQDMRSNLELYADHEIKDELIIGPVVLQPKIISGELNDETETHHKTTSMKIDPTRFLELSALKTSQENLNENRPNQVSIKKTLPSNKNNALPTRPAKVRCTRNISEIVSEERSNDISDLRQRPSQRMASESVEQHNRLMENLRRRSSQRLTHKYFEQRERHLEYLRRPATKRMASESVEEHNRRLEYLRWRKSQRKARKSVAQIEQCLEDLRCRASQRKPSRNVEQIEQYLENLRRTVAQSLVSESVQRHTSQCKTNTLHSVKQNKQHQDNLRQHACPTYLKNDPKSVSSKYIKFMKMAPINNIETEDPNRNTGNEFRRPIKLEISDMHEQKNCAIELNEIENVIVKKEDDIEKKLEGNAVKKEVNETEETTKNSIENQSDLLQDTRSLELYSDHEIEDELAIGPVVLQPQITSGELNDENTIEDSTTKPDSFTSDNSCESEVKKYITIEENGNINKYLVTIVEPRSF